MNEETIRAALCGKKWQCTLNGKCSIQFNEDGTGHLFCGVELHHFIAHKIEWKQSPTTATSLDLDERRMIGQGEEEVAFSLDITLTDMTLTTRLGRARKRVPLMPSPRVDSAANVSKSYELRLARGKFAMPLQVPSEREYNFRDRLSFDPSPYPPSEEWLPVVIRPVRQCKFWEYKDFFFTALPAKEE